MAAPITIIPGVISIYYVDTDKVLTDKCPRTIAGNILFGQWEFNKYEYRPKDNCIFAAIYDVGAETVEVVASQTVIECRRSSCFPGKGNAEVAGNVLAYCMPKEYLDENWLKQNEKRIVKVDG